MPLSAAFHSVGLADVPILEAIAKVGAAGYSGIELNAETLPWARPHVTPATGAAEREAIVAACAAAGLSIPAVGAHVGMVAADAAAREAAVTFVEGCIDLAKDVGSPVVHVLSGPVDAATDERAAWSWFADAVERTTDYARTRGIALAVEAIAGHLFHEIDDYHKLRRELAGVAFRINFDPSHLIVQGEDPRRLVKELGDDIVHVHMKDGAGLYPDFSFPPLGMGRIDFAALLADLRAAGYAGALSVEYEAQVFGFRQSEAEILGHGRRFLQGLGV